MNAELSQLVYLVAVVLFVLGIKRLSSPATARSGNRLSALGMLVAVSVTLVDQSVISYGWVIVGLAIGAGLGVLAAQRVAMTSMPELVAGFNGLGGGASALVATSAFVAQPTQDLVPASALAASVLIGGITLTGSLVALAKLAGKIKGTPVSYPWQRVGDTFLGVLALAAAVSFATGGGSTSFWLLVALSLVLGVLRVLPIGGGDMPVVIAFLNSLSGVAASMAGFALDSSVLIIAGAIVGASGLILTGIMVKAMNRTLWAVLAGGFGAVAEGSSETGTQPVRRTNPEDLAPVLAYARSVVIIPGYGLAVAQAQHVMRELADLLEERGVSVRYAIHPVAGRMPGHMNVLLAEADVSYDLLVDMEDINSEFSHTDVALVVGANDVVNPSAREDASSPIYGMPILNVDHATTVVVIKRSLSPGFAGIDNPLFYAENTLMLFADAKAAVSELVSEVRDL